MDLEVKAPRAVRWCRKHGIECTVETAIELVEKHLAELLIEDYKQGDDVVPFDECEEGCGSWDTNENRCECGNTRVSWGTNIDWNDLDNSYVYPEPC